MATRRIDLNTLPPATGPVPAKPVAPSAEQVAAARAEPITGTRPAKPTLPNPPPATEVRTPAPPPAEGIAAPTAAPAAPVPVTVVNQSAPVAVKPAEVQTPALPAIDHGVPGYQAIGAGATAAAMSDRTRQWVTSPGPLPGPGSGGAAWSQVMTHASQQSARNAFTSPVAAYDRPIPVIIVGPNPLPVTGGVGKPGKPAGDDGGAKGPDWLAPIMKQVGYVSGRAETAVTGVARNEAIPALIAGAELANVGLSKLGPVGMVAGTVIEGFAAGVKAAAATVDAFVERGKQIEQWSGAIAGAGNRAEIIRMQSEMREADDSGEQYAKMIELQAKTEAVLSETLRPIKNLAMEGLAFLMEQLMGTIKNVLEGLNELAGIVGSRSKKIDEMVKRIADIMEGGGDKALIDGWLLAPLFAGVMAPAPGAPAAPVPGPGLGVPLVAGGP